MSETGFLAARGGSCGADGVLKPKADGVKMLKLFIARVVRPTIKSFSLSALTLIVKYTVCMISSSDWKIMHTDSGHSVRNGVLRPSHVCDSVVKLL